MIKILFAASKYDYANPELGLSNEYYFFYDTLKRMKGVSVEIFDWVSLHKKYGKEKMNDLLYQKCKKERPDLVLFSIFENEFDKEIVKSISQDLRVTTFNIFTNDAWQYEIYSKGWAKNFSYIATDDHAFIKKYQTDIGMKNVLPWHWGVNQYVWTNLNLPKTMDVSFVGQAYGNRKGIIRGIQKAGINIETFGRGFKNGKISFEEMIKIFNKSKINLNISEHSRKMQYVKFLPEIFQPSTVDPGSFQMKARIFEVTGCGGFLLTTYGEPLKQYFKIGKEIETYKSFDEMIEKIKFYLINESARNKIAKAGYLQTIKKYTYTKLLTKTLIDLGLPIST